MMDSPEVTSPLNPSPNTKPLIWPFNGIYARVDLEVGNTDINYFTVYKTQICCKATVY